jgi:predicted ATPase
LLVFLANQLKDARLLVLCTYCPGTEREGQVSLSMNDLLRSDRSSCISLAGLKNPEVAQYLELTVGSRPPDGVAAAVHERTGGNPLFLRQLVHAFSAAGRPDGWAWLDCPAADQNLKESIEHWLRRLSPTCRRVLQTAAVVGREFSLATLARSAELPPADVLNALCEAELAGVVRRTEGNVGGYRYAHTLMRELLYDQHPQTKPVAIHPC